MPELTVAAAQYAPVYLDTAATIEKCATIADEASRRGVDLLVFPECFVSGYPEWVWRTRPWSKTARASYRLLFEQAIEVPGPDADALATIARSHRLHLAVGVTERYGSTLYNTLLVFGPDGALLLHHRKLMPTGGERLVWGSGDGSSVRAVETPIGRIGGLICWENYMPLARTALYADDVQIHLAPTWDSGDVWVPTLQHIAKEGRTYVIGACQAFHTDDVPAGIPGREEMYPEPAWIARGLSTIVHPNGKILAGPLADEEGLVVADIDVDNCADGRGLFDATGHYARPDVFQLIVDRTPRRPVGERDTANHVPGLEDAESG
ncbi:carbon-nitrogen hydrolase family protein [Microbacterium mangrovi]|uniref:carbon-nitrogen hydrolase family protein n=1 Tax=Microbacterium mangrovi TaxID=1348253 RepID=UPI0009DCAEA3|nr:carbon-nitrogen hydrolase family protein [Microbacterium mangrovi]